MQTKIHKNTFKGCSSLQRINLPPGLTEIGDCAFQDCSQLRSVEMGSSVKNIGVSAFCGASALTSVDRLNGPRSGDPSRTFETVGDYAFAGTGIRTANLALRSSAIQTFWGDGCFQGCRDLEYVHFLSANYMSRNMFKDCAALTAADWDVHLMAYTYPGIFDGCSSLQRAALPAELLFVPEGAFRGCGRLSSMQFTSYGDKSAIDEVQRNAFNGCDSISSLELPASVDSIDEMDQECLSGMKRLKAVTFHGIGLDQLAQTESGSIEFPVRLTLNQKDSVYYEDYLAQFESYEDYAASNLDSDEDRRSEIEYEEARARVRQNYAELSTAYRAAVENDMPLALAVGITYQDDYGGYWTRQDLIPEALDEPTPEFEPAAAVTPPSFLLSARVAGKSFACKYARDRELVWLYEHGMQDFDRESLSGEGYSKAEIDRYERYALSGETKQQISAVFMGYILDIGQVHAWNDDDGPVWDNESRYMSKLTAAINSRLTAFMGKCAPKAGLQTGFGAVRQFLLTSDSTLKNYSNYGIIRVVKGKSGKTVTGVKFDSRISSHDALTDLADAEYQEICDYAYEKGVDIPYDYDPSYTWPMLNKRVAQALADVHCAPLSLDLQYQLSDERLLEDITAVKTANAVSAVEHTGFFGLRHDVEVSCRGMQPGQTWHYLYDPSAYKPPPRVEYESDKEVSADFELGKWYYNAEDVYRFARQRGTPCLFIYSLWGCGPCAVYQKQLWNSEAFQDWFEKQHFLLCGLECEQQPMYDRHLRFLVDEVSPSAENFAKEDEGQSMDSVPANTLGQKFRRYMVGDVYASSLMTPVLVFMDKEGKCWDYTYHNIARDIRRFGVEGMLQQLKSLCLYHFDSNSLMSAEYVVDAGKAFDPADYSGSMDNPWLAGEGVMNMSTSIPDYEYAAVMTVAQLERYMSDTLRNFQQYSSVVPDGLVYLAGCLFGSFSWFSCMFAGSGTDLEELTTAEELTQAFAGWRFKIGDSYYRMTFSAKDKTTIDNPCIAGAEEDVFRMVMVQAN